MVYFFLNDSIHLFMYAFAVPNNYNYLSEKSLLRAVFNALIEASKEGKLGFFLFEITYTLFHISWATSNFSKDQLRTVSAYVIISMPQSNEGVYEVINKRDLKVSLRATDMSTPDSCYFDSCFFPIRE